MVNFKLQKCAAYQDLPTLQFWSKSHCSFWSYFPFFHQIFKILILFVLYFKNYKRQMVSWNCKHVQHVKIYKKMSHSWKCATTVWRVIPLEMHFFIDSLLLVTQIIKGKLRYYKMWSSKSQILRIIDICFLQQFW